MTIPETPITREEKYLDAMVKALDGGGGGSGDGVMVVNLTLSGGNYTADKTMGEIRAAMAEGKPAFLFYNGNLEQHYYAISEAISGAALKAVAINRVSKRGTSYTWGDNQEVDSLEGMGLYGVSSADASTEWRTNTAFYFTNLLDYAPIPTNNAPVALLFDHEDGPRWGTPPSIKVFDMTDMSASLETVIGTLKQQSAATGSASLAFYFEHGLLASIKRAMDERTQPWMVIIPQSAPHRFWELSDTTFSNIANNLSSATFIGHDVDTEQSGGNLTAHLYTVSVTFTPMFVYVKVDADTQTVIDPTTLLGGE